MWSHTIAGPLAATSAGIEGILGTAIPWSAELPRSGRWGRPLAAVGRGRRQRPCRHPSRRRSHWGWSYPAQGRARMPRGGPPAAIVFVSLSRLSFVGCVSRSAPPGRSRKIGLFTFAADVLALSTRARCPMPAALGEGFTPTPTDGGATYFATPSPPPLPLCSGAGLVCGAGHEPHPSLCLSSRQPRRLVRHHVSSRMRAPSRAVAGLAVGWRCGVVETRSSRGASASVHVDVGSCRWWRATMGPAPARLSSNRAASARQADAGSVWRARCWADGGGRRACEWADGWVGWASVGWAVVRAVVEGFSMHEAQRLKSPRGARRLGASAGRSSFDARVVLGRAQVPTAGRRPSSGSPHPSCFELCRTQRGPPSSPPPQLNGARRPLPDGARVDGRDRGPGRAGRRCIPRWLGARGRGADGRQLRDQ